MEIREVLDSELREAVAQRLGPTRFELWFGEGVELGIHGDHLKVMVPNGFFREWIRNHFATDLVEAAQAVTGNRLHLSIEVIAQTGDSEVDAREPAGSSGASPTTVFAQGARHSPGRLRSEGSDGTGKRASAPELIGSARTSQPGLIARPGRRMESFVVGPGNRVAHAAAVAMAEGAGQSFNPLLIHGGIGLGKTHLLEGIATAWRSRLQSWNVVLVTAEVFTNGFLDAMRGGTLPEFRRRYRQLHALLLDDVHFLAAKRATMDEFLHTFNTLVNAGCPVVMAADQHPRLIPKMTEELVTRFLAGMVVKIEPPDAETRRAILRSKAAARGVELPEEVLAHLTAHLRGSVRELEGALNCLIGYAQLTGRRIDLGLAQSALRETIRYTAQNIALKDIERVICEYYGLTVEALRSDTRRREVAWPRMMGMYLARKHTQASYGEIGRFFGGRNHTTVIAAEKKISARLQEEQRSGLLTGIESTADVLSSLERALQI